MMWLSTKEAARVYGCSPYHWLRLAKQYGAVPRVETYQGARDGVWGNGYRYQWQDEAVLRIRAEHKLSKIRTRKEAVKTRRNGRPLARQTFLENRRQIILARIKERECQTTK